MQNDRVILSNDLREMPRSTWDALRHPSFYLSYDWLVARSITIGGTAQFLMMHDECGRPLLGFPLYTISATSHPGYDPVGLLLNAAHSGRLVCSSADAYILQQLCTILERERGGLRPALVVAAPGRSGGLSYGHGVTALHALQLLETACDALDSLAVQAGAPVSAWLYVPEGTDQTLHRTLSSRGYVPVLMDAECYLPIRWGTFDGYLRLFPARRRKTIRQEMKRFSNAGFHVEFHGAEALTRELALLEVQWRAKYGRDVSVTDVETQYALLREHLDQRVRVFVARQKERTVGFTVFFEHLGIWYSRFGGFDYDVGKIFSYFNLLFYEPVREAIRRGITCIRYSTSSIDTKRRRGCLLANVLMYVRFPRSLVPTIGLQALDRIQHEQLDLKPSPPEIKNPTL